MIKVFATGNIGKDAEVTKVSNEHSVVKFSIASNKVVKGEKQTTWLFCQKWNADKLAPYLKKGTFVSLAGELEIREHEGKTFTTMNVWDLEFGGAPKQDEPKPEGNQEIKTDRPSTKIDVDSVDENSDLPF